MKPKILMLGWEFSPQVSGGVGIACVGIAKALHSHVDLSVITPHVKDGDVLKGAEEFLTEQVEVSQEYTYQEFLDVVEQVYPSISPYGNVVNSSYLKKEKITRTDTKNFSIEHFYPVGGVQDEMYQKVLAYTYEAINLGMQKSFDVIYAHDWVTFLAGVELKKRTGKPLVLHIHSLQYDRSGADPKDKGWIYEIERHGMMTADLIIAVSAYTANVCEYHYGILSDNISVVHNGINSVKSYRKENKTKEKVVVFIGRVTSQKSPNNFLKIAKEILNTNQKVRFVIAGVGDELAEMKSIVKKSIELKSKVEFRGHLSRKGINDLLAIADVYCMPSVSEPFGLSALEAVQFAVPVVVSRQSGVAEVLSGALVAEYWDVRKMAGHVLELLKNKKIHKKAVETLQKDVLKLTWENTTQKLLTVMSSKGFIS